MTTPTEQTLESEIGLEYSHDLDRDYGLLTDANALAATAATTVSTGQPATIGANATSLNANGGVATTTGQASTLTLGPLALTATIGTSETTVNPATLGLGNTTLASPTGQSTITGHKATLTVPWWMLDGRPMPVDSDFSVDAQTISLPFRSTTETIGHWRQYDRAGDVDVELGFAGSYRAIDRSGLEGSHTLEPPKDDRPPFVTTETYVQEYQESQLGPDLFSVELTLHRTQNREQEFEPVSETGNPWGLTLEDGTLSLDNEQVGRVEERSGSEAGSELGLPLLLSDEQTATILDNCGYPGAVVERSVPDGSDFRVDDTGGRQTVSLNTPVDSLESGEWLVSDWSVEHWSFEPDRRWRVELDLSKPAD